MVNAIVNPSPMPNPSNKDGKIGIGDLNYVADYISASTEEKNTIITKESQLKSADITGDGKIRIGDLNAIADSI